MRKYKTYLKDILEAINKIEKYTLNLSLEEFIQNELIQDGVIRNLEIIGEAIKNSTDNSCICTRYEGSRYM